MDIVTWNITTKTAERVAILIRKHDSRDLNDEEFVEQLLSLGLPRKPRQGGDLRIVVTKPTQVGYSRRIVTP